MMVTKHISLDDDHIEKMKPYLEKHHGNTGDALKELINHAEKYSSRMNSSAIDISLLNWMLKEIKDILVPDKVLDEIIAPALTTSMPKFKEYVNRRLSELEWDIDLVLKYDNDEFPSNISIEMRGAPQKIQLVACILCHFLVKNSLQYAPLEIKYAVNINDCIKVELSRSNREEALKSLIICFGGMDEVKKIIKSKPAFWKSVINRHLLSNYNMVTVHRNYLEDLLADKVPLGEIMIETLAKKPVQELPLMEMLSLVKEVYEASRVVDRVDIDKDTITISHNYRTKEAIDKLKSSLVMLLESNGHLYDAKSTTNTIVLTHMPDVGIKINEMVNNLITSNSTVDKELLMFIAFLGGLKDIPDIPLSLSSLGRRIGTSLIKEYEKENGIKDWNLEAFQKALETIDSKLHRESEWKLEGKNLLYTIRKCRIVTEGNTFDTYICHTVRETFKGALNYAFGNKAELRINKLISHGDNFCEVVIRIP